MTLPVSPLAKICDVVREHINTLGEVTSPSDWDISVTIGAPGVNLATAHSKNTLNLFFYRFEPFSFAADAMPGDVQWMKVLCVITAFGIDEEGQEELGNADGGFFEEVGVLEGDGTSVGGDDRFAHLAEEGKAVCCCFCLVM